MAAAAHFHRGLLHPRYWLIWLVIGLWWLVSQLPYSVQVLFARMLAPLLYRLGTKRRHIVETNLRLCFPELTDEQRQTLVRENFFSMSMALFETGMAWFWKKSRIDRMCTVEGLEHIPPLEQRQQGIVLIGLHFTHLDLGGGYLAHRRPFWGMYRSHKNPVFDYVQRRGRERHSSSTGVFTRKEVRTMYRVLRQKGLVWYAPDQDYGRKHSVFAPFFGIEAATVTATAKFAQLGNAQVIPFVQRRLPDNRGYEIRVYPPLEGYPTGDEVMDASQLNRFVEERVREHPEQYLWAHRRFKTRPPGADKVY